MRLWLTVDASVDGTWQTSALDVIANEWNFITITFDKSSLSNDPIFYINGTSRTVGEISTPTVAFVDDSSIDLCLGQAVSNTASVCNTIRTFDGSIDEMRMVDEILTADWIKADWECQRGAVDNDSCITIGDEGIEPTNDHFYSDTLAITDSLVFIYNDLNPDFTETLDLTDTYTQLCTGTCGVTPTPNAIILSVNKSPFIFGVYSDATRMTCEMSISGGVIWNSDDLNLNICNSTQWILPDGTGT